MTNLCISSVIIVKEIKIMSTITLTNGIRVSGSSQGFSNGYVQSKGYIRGTLGYAVLVDAIVDLKHGIRLGQDKSL